jgi:hypothetical protein
MVSTSQPFTPGPFEAVPLLRSEEHVLECIKAVLMYTVLLEGQSSCLNVLPPLGDILEALWNK